MADNANVTQGDGSIIVATDKIGGVDYQRTKVTWGVDGTATDVSVANPLPVTDLDVAQEVTLQAVRDRIGEVQASPTANTVLDRLKALLTGTSLAASTNAIGKLAANDGVDIGDATINGPLGRAADAASVSTALSTEDVALLNALLTTSDFDAKVGAAVTGETLEAGGSGILGWLSSVRKRLPTALGGTTAANSFPVVLSSDGPFATNFGATTDAESASGNGSGIAIWKRIRTLLNGGLPAALGAGGGLKVDGSGTALPITPAATELHLGEVGGNSTIITPTITVDTAAYAVGDSIGGKITLANVFRAAGHGAVLQNIHIIDRSNQKPTGSLLFFNADPTAATITDNAAFVYSTDDLKQIARIPVATSDYVTINSKAIGSLPNLGRVVTAASGTSLYLAFVADGAPDFVATTDLQISFGFLRD